MIWCAQSKESRYTFNYASMKALNENLQMRSDWLMPICSGGGAAEGQAGPEGAPDPEARSPAPPRHPGCDQARRGGAGPVLRVSGTTARSRSVSAGVIGIERDPGYIDRRGSASPMSRRWPSANRSSPPANARSLDSLRQDGGARLAEAGACSPVRPMDRPVRADGTLISADHRGSIHQVGAALQGAAGLQRLDVLVLQGRRTAGLDRHSARAGPGGIELI